MRGCRRSGECVPHRARLAVGLYFKVVRALLNDQLLALYRDLDFTQLERKLTVPHQVGRIPDHACLRSLRIADVPFLTGPCGFRKSRSVEFPMLVFEALA